MQALLFTEHIDPMPISDPKKILKTESKKIATDILNNPNTTMRSRLNPALFKQAYNNRATDKPFIVVLDMYSFSHLFKNHLKQHPDCIVLLQKEKELVAI